MLPDPEGGPDDHDTDSDFDGGQETEQDHDCDPDGDQDHDCDPEELLPYSS